MSMLENALSGARYATRAYAKLPKTKACKTRRKANKKARKDRRRNK